MVGEINLRYIKDDTNKFMDFAGDLGLSHLTKSVVQVQDWTAVAQNGVGESAIYDNSANYSSALNIQAFLDSTAAHLGSEFLVQASANPTGNEDWQDLVRFLALAGTALDLTTTNNPAPVGTTVFTSGTVAAGWEVKDLPSRIVGIKDIDVLADSELMLQTGYVLDTSITVQDGSTNAHAINSVIYSIAMTQNITLPTWVNRVRVFVNNNYDNGGSSLNYKVRASIVTSL